MKKSLGVTTMDNEILLTGEALRKFVFEEQTNVIPIAENFVYKKSITMRSGDPGVGKSTYNANMIRDLSAGLPVFNFFHTPKPVFCYYIPFERGAYEIAQRLKALSSVIEPVWDNIIIKPDFIGYDVFDGKQALHFVDSVRKDLDNIKLCKQDMEIVIFFDPIISMVSGEIKEEKYAKAITRCANIIQTHSYCAIELTNHTVKQPVSKKNKGKVDPFYGSQAFKAFCTSGVYISRNTEYGGVDMQSTKSSHGNVLEYAHLSYDSFTYSLFGKAQESGLKNYDKVLATVRAIFQSGMRQFTFSNVIKHSLCSGVSASSAKEIILGEEPFKSGISAITGVGKATLLNFTPEWEYK